MINLYFTREQRWGVIKLALFIMLEVVFVMPRKELSSIQGNKKK